MQVRKSLDRLRQKVARWTKMQLPRIRSLSKASTMRLFQNDIPRLIKHTTRLRMATKKMWGKLTAWMRETFISVRQPEFRDKVKSIVPMLRKNSLVAIDVSYNKIRYIGSQIVKFVHGFMVWIRNLPVREGIEWVRSYRLRLLSAVSAIGVASVLTVGANQYVNINTFDIYHVMVDGVEMGVVSDPQLIEDIKLSKYSELEKQYPDLTMVLNAFAVTFRHEKAFKAQADDAAVLEKMNSVLKAHPVGVQLKVDGKVIGILKNKDVAQQVLNQIKDDYTPVKAKESSSKTSLMAITKQLEVGESRLEKVDFVQTVSLDYIQINPEQLSKPEDVLNKLRTGDVTPTKYTVEKGDCVGCIAKKFELPRQLIYKNNPWIVDDVIKVGQVIDLTVLKPTLSVRTVETIMENQEIQFDTEYVKDDNLRAGVVQVVTPGKNGLKKVTIQVTKVNGFMESEQMLGEELITEPVKALAKKGTKIILGEGTGKFSWPVVSPSISSVYGQRWGQLHKGIDITSGNRSILTADTGKISYVGYKSDYGNHIIVDHLNGYRSLYGHLSSIGVKVGQIVEKGERIGVMGSTGESTGIHLHFEIIVNGISENPLKYLNR